MQREIKFRAWLTLSDYDEEGNDKDYRAMIDGVSISSGGYVSFSLEQGNCAFGGDIFERAVENGNAYEYDEWCTWEGSFKLMQYTGLKDKNGLEIYEGDILQRESSINRDYHGEWIRDEVIYKPGVFFVRHISSDKGKLPRGYTAGELLSIYFDYDRKLFAFSSDYEPSCLGEVIGNIYENPELLEANQ